METNTLNRSADRPSIASSLVAVLVMFLVLAALGPVLQGCGEDLVIGGQLVPTPVATSTTPTETPDNNEN